MTFLECIQCEYIQDIDANLNELLLTKCFHRLFVLINCITKNNDKKKKKFYCLLANLYFHVNKISRFSYFVQRK